MKKVNAGSVCPPRVVGAFLLLAVAITFPKAFAESSVEWEFPFEGQVQSPTLYPSAAESEGVIAAAGSCIALINGKGSLRWRFEVDSRPITPAAAADLDGDGSVEVVVSLADGSVLCLDALGNRRWRTKVDVGCTDNLKSIAVVDAVAESKGLEIIAGFDEAWLHCISAEGIPLWRFNGGLARTGPPTATDVDGDGRLEIIYGTDEGNVYCLDGWGRVKWWRPIGHPLGRSGPLIADLDGDGHAMALITRSFTGQMPQLLALDGRTGEPVWAAAYRMSSYLSIAAADINTDGVLEVLYGDKDNRLHCVDAGGKELWNADLAQRGIFYAPAIADVDGDGQLEAIVGVRNTDFATGTTMYVIGPQGEIEERLALGESAKMAPAVGDIDGDGELEVLAVSESPNTMYALTWKARGEVAWPSLRGDSAMSGSIRVAPGAPASKTPPPRKGAAGVRFDAGPLYFGENVIRAEWQDAPGADVLFEVSIERPSGPVERYTARAAAKTGEAEVHFRVASKAAAEVSARLMTSSPDSVFAAQHWTLKPLAPSAWGVDGLQKACNAAVETGMAAADVSGIIARLGALKETSAYLDAATGLTDEQLASQADALRQSARTLKRWADIAKETWSTGEPMAYVYWQDDDPWNHFDPTALPEGPPSEAGLRIDAFQNEKESIALNLLNLTGRPIDVRCTFQSPAQSGNQPGPVAPLANRFQLRRILAVPGQYGEMVYDALPELDNSGAITIAPGQIEQLWIVTDTKDLAPGSHSALLHLSDLAVTPTHVEVPIGIEVWPLSLPERGYAQMTWTRIDVGEVSDQQIEDMLAHEVSVAYGPELPAMRLDAEGRLKEEVDWAHVDASLARLPEHFQFLFHAPPPLEWPQGVKPEEGSALHIAGLRSALREMSRHLERRGYGNEQWALYPMDEPWLWGFRGIDTLRTFCKRIREADPEVRLYANPIGSARIEYIEEFKELIDIWQPNVDVPFRGRDFVEWFDNNAEKYWMFIVNYHAKDLFPLDYYRGIAWMAWMFGAEGAGFWIYGPNDLWRP